MALNFTTQIELQSGITVDNAYGRVSAVDQANGEFVDAIVDIYVSEQAYVDGKQPIAVSFNRTVRVNYNRGTDGTDILNIAHEGLIIALANEGITATKEL